MQEAQGTQDWSLSWEDPLKEEMATHSSILAWRSPWTEEPGKLQSLGPQSRTWMVTEHRCQLSPACSHLRDLLESKANKGPSDQGYGFSRGHVWMWELDGEESWVPKDWCFWTMVLDKTLESPLDCKEIQPVHPKGDLSWVFTGRTDAEAETPILWPPDVKSWLVGKDPDAGKDWGQEEKGTTEDEMVGCHHRLNGHWFGWTPGVGDGQGGLACCGSWGCKESDMTEQLNWTELEASLWFQQIPQSWLLYGSLIPCICRMPPLHLMIYITITPSSLLSLIPKKDPLSTHICWVYLLEVLLGRVT